jgi:hypothetical protein
MHMAKLASLDVIQTWAIEHSWLHGSLVKEPLA